MTIEQTVMYSGIEEETFSIIINLKQWKNLKKKIDQEFSSEYGDFSEVRIYHSDSREISVEGHVMLVRKR